MVAKRFVSNKFVVFEEKSLEMLRILKIIINFANASGRNQELH